MPGWGWLLTIAVGYSIFWYLLMSLIGIASGWNKLGLRYPLREPFAGTHYRFQTARFRFGMKYNHTVTVGANSEGFYLSMFFLFRPSHPTVFIPWEDVQAKEVKVWFTHWLEFRFANAPGVYVQLPLALGKKLASSALRAWEHDTPTNSTGALPESENL